jgi:hypothetical protein
LGFDFLAAGPAYLVREQTFPVAGMGLIKNEVN